MFCERYHAIGPPEVSSLSLKPGLLSISNLVFAFLLAHAPLFSAMNPVLGNQTPTPQAYTQGMSLLAAGKANAALALFRQALKIAPQNLLLLNATGAALCLEGKVAESEVYFLSALKVDPNFNPARKNLAIAYFNLGRYEDATPHLQKLWRTWETRPEANLFLGMIATEQHRYEEAIRYLHEAGPLVDQQPRALLSLARSTYEAGDKRAVPALMEKLQKQPGLTANDYVEIAALDVTCERYQAALSSLDAAATLDIALPGITYKRAYVLSKMGRYDEALTLLQEIVGKSADGLSLSLLAEVAENEGKLELAIQAMRKAIEIEPLAEDHYLDLSLFCAKYKNDQLAEEMIDLGLKQVPGSYRLLVQEGITLEKLGKRKESEQAFASAMKRQKDHSLALSGLGITYLISNELAEALKSLAAGVKDFPHDFYIHYLYAYALERSIAVEEDNARTTEEIKQNLEEAIKLNPSFAESYYHLGKLYSRTDLNFAISNFESALRLDPADLSAKYQLARLYLKTDKQTEGKRLMTEVEKEKADKLIEERKPQMIAVKR